jgi:pyruvate dehydrogenase E2 component (dihydrolipoamide acetyltransferase)
MAQIIGLPKLSPTMEEGVLVRWTKKEGEKVSPGDLVAEVETDKANMDFNIEDEGVLLKLLVAEGDTVKLGAPVAILGSKGEDVAELVEQAKSQAAAPAPEPAKPAPAPAKPAPAKPAAVAKPAPAPAKPAPAKPAPARPAAPAAKPAPAAAKPAPAAKPALAPAARPEPPAAPIGARLLASPLAKTLAIELGIDLRQVTGTGPGGRIVERDVRTAADHGGAAIAADEVRDAEPEESAPDVAEDGGGDRADRTDDADQADHADSAAPEARRGSQALTVRPRAPSAAVRPDGDGDFSDVPLSSTRKRIASRLTEAKRDAPHFYLMRDLDAAPLLAYRQRLNALVSAKSPGAKISVNDLLVKATALALRRMPECNAAWAGDAIRQFHRVHVGVAVAIPDGLVTPVVRDADLKGIGAIAAEVKDLAERAKRRGLKAHEITGSTFSVSNLGMFDIERFTAILNPPESGILAIGAVRDAVVAVNGAPAVGKRLAVTMSCDHRVIDGATGAKWLQVFAELIENPESLAL